MSTAKFIQVCLVLGLLALGFVSARQPLINENGRFKFVDKIQTITVNASFPIERPLNELVRRDEGLPQLCRPKCSGRKVPASPALRKRLDVPTSNKKGSSTSSNPLHIFTKRVINRLPPPNTPNWLSRVIQNPDLIQVLTFDTYDENGVNQEDGTPANSAEFMELGAEPFNMGLSGLGGCTVIVVVSRRGIWFAHIFESVSFNPDAPEPGQVLTDAEVEHAFVTTGLDFLNTGQDLEWGLQYTSLADVAQFFQPDDCPRAYFMTPQRQSTPPAPQANGDPGDTPIVFLPGLHYEDKIIRLRGRLQEIVGQIPVTVYAYQPLDDNPIGDTDGRGIALYQYDPAATKHNPPHQGARLIFEGGTIEVTIPIDGRDQTYTFERGQVYRDYWTPATITQCEPQPLLRSSGWQGPEQGPEQGPDDVESCGGQPYQESQYICYGDMTLCPIIDGVATLLCGSQCYSESLYVCYDTKLCPVIDGIPTLACGEDCYLESQYSCVDDHLVQAEPTISPVQPTTSASTSVIPIPAPSGIEVVIDGKTYTIPLQSSTVIDGQTITAGSDGLIIGTQTIPIPATQTEPLVITTGGVTFTVLPTSTSSGVPTVGPSPPSSSTGTDIPTTQPEPGPTPTTSTASSTIVPIPVPPASSSTSTVMTITGTDGSHTEVTFTPTTFTEFSSITDVTTVVTSTNGVVSTIVIGPGGVAWDPVTTGTNTDMTLVPFPTVPPSPPPPAPSSSSTLPPETSTSSIPGSVPFPSSIFPLPPIVTTVITTDGPDGPVTSTITGTTDSDGVVVPIATLSTAAAISSAEALVSELNSLSSVISSFSENPTDSASASAATSGTNKVHDDTDDFGRQIGTSGGGLCFIFCGSLSSVSSALGSLKDLISQVTSGLSGAGALTAPLSDLNNLSQELSNDIDEAKNSASSSSSSSDSSTTPQPSPPPSTTSTTCTPGTATNCEVYCATGTVENTPTTSCFSTTCSIATTCGDSTQGSTSTTSFEFQFCPTEPIVDSTTMSLWSYPGYTFVPLMPYPTDDLPSSSSVPPRPTSVIQCSSSAECPACGEDEDPCCLSGCHGMLVPGSNTCGCIPKGGTVSPVCGCLS